MIVYETDLADVSPGDLDGFFVDWPAAPTREQRLALLRGGEHAVLARDDRSRRIVGFVTVVGDGVLTAFVPLLEVLPEYQGRGIGTELARRALELVGDRYSVDVVCDEDLVPFYERLGMTRLAGMALRNRDALAG